MVFSSVTFIFYFLPLVLMAYYSAPKPFKNGVLLLSSLMFYFAGEPKFFALFFGSMVINYFAGRAIAYYRKTSYGKGVFALSVAINLGLLGVFKYANFFVDSFQKLLQMDLQFIRLALPIGISFYTFQAISYLVDVYREEVPAQMSFVNLALYIALFPQLIAGPIVRYKTIDEALASRTHTAEMFAEGIQRFVIGLSKKILIANQLGETWGLALGAKESTVMLLWLGAVGFTLQIYFDFSAYSDMAIGLGKMFGFEFNENFRHPFMSKSITEFWRRWHISLGTWFRDYLYIPLGGNRVTNVRWGINIAIVWLLTGLWHGAAWQFVLWGGLFGVLLVLEKAFLGKVLLKLPAFTAHFYVMVTVILSFVLFNSASISEGIRLITGMLGLRGLPFLDALTVYYYKSYGILLILGAVGSTDLLQRMVATLGRFNKLEVIKPVVLFCLLVLSTAYLVDASFNPFLYFRF